MQSQLNKVCNQSKYSDLYRNYFFLSRTNQIMVEVLAPISTICAILNIVFFIKFPNTRQPPFDILLLITIFSLVNISVYLATISIYDSVHPPGEGQKLPDDFSNFCQVTGVLRFLSQFGETIYNTIFCIYYTFKIRNPLKTWNRQNKQIHALCFIITVVGVIVIYVSQQIGVSVIGICGLKVTKSSSFIELTMFSLYLFILVSTSVVFLKYLKRISQFDLKARQFFKYYLIYALVISLIYITETVIIILLIVDCFAGLAENVDEIISVFANALILSVPIATTLIIVFHPEFGKKILKQIVQKIRKKFDNNQNGRQSLMIEMTQIGANAGYLSNIKQQNRVSLLSTILGCISLNSEQRKYNTQLKNRSTIGSSQEQHIYSWNYTDVNQLQIDQAVVLENSDFFVDKVPTVKIKFISYATSVFQNLMDQDKVDYLQQSTNPHKNLQKVYKNAQADGGSSGQFFFFTYNNRILLKTINPNELIVLLDRLQNYYKYLRQHTQSFIVKIYGVFKVVMMQTQEEVSFMMMGNLCEDIDRKYILRIYDCKGSSHQRQVFKQSKQHQQPEYSKKTMKDVDFGRLQHKVWINKQQSIGIRNILKQDSLFFFENGLIDYSLIIMKIDYSVYLLDIENRKPTFNKRTMFYNQKQPHMIYVLGIIDYLQTWNVKKKGQRWYKSLFTQSDTISSQSPAYYSQRFIQNLVEKIFE